MVKTIIKELIILLLVSLAILLILGIVLYDYMPNNKVIPKVEMYEKSAEMKEVLLEAKAEESTKVVLTYKITDTDLNMYKKTNEYVAGKINPFAEYTPEVPNENTDESTGGNNTNSGTGSSSSNSSSGNSSSSSTTGGTLFENTTTK